MKTDKINNIIKVIVVISAITLPWSIPINNICIILLTVLSVYKHIIINPQIKVYNNKYFFVSSIFLLYKFISILYSDNKSMGLFDIEKTLSFLVLPYVFMINKGVFKVKNIINYFTISVMAFLVFHLLKLCFHNPLERMFFIEEDGFNIRRAFHTYYGIHPTYFSLFMLFSAIYSITLMSKNWALNILWISISAIFLLFIWMLAARIVIIGAIIIFIIFIVKNYTRQHLLYYMASFATITILLITSYSLTPSFKNRFMEVINSEKTPPQTNETMNSTNIRIAQLICTKEIVKNQNWLIGEGIGDVQDILNSCFKNNHWASNLYLENYNFHNQYTQYFVALGLIGLLFYLYLAIYPLVYGLKYNNILLYSIAILLVITSLTECVMATQKGVVFFCFFINLLLFAQDYDISKNNLT